MNAVLEHVLALHTRALAPVPFTRDDVRHAAVGVLARSWKPWRISFAMHVAMIDVSPSATIGGRS